MIDMSIGQVTGIIIGEPTSEPSERPDEPTVWRMIYIRTEHGLIQIKVWAFEDEDLSVREEWLTPRIYQPEPEAAKDQG